MITRFCCWIGWHSIESIVADGVDHRPLTKVFCCECGVTLSLEYR